MRPAGLPTAITDFVEQWGYLALVAGVALGLPVPEDVWLAAGGYLAWAGLLSFRWVVFVGVAGAVTADNLGYWIGRLGRRRLLDRFGRYVLVTPARLRQAEAFFLRHGEKAVFFARFIAGLRFSAGPLAGVSRMPFPRFFAYNFAGALIWVPAMVTVGYLFAPNLDRVLGLLRRGQRVVAAVILLTLLAGLAMAGLRRRHRRNRSPS